MKEKFCSAIERARSLNPAQHEQLKLYGLYKRVIAGHCPKEIPSSHGLVGDAKWTAWNACDHMSEENAISEYIRLVDQLSAQASTDDQDSNTSGKRMSRPLQPEKTEGACDLQKFSNSDINQKDENGLAPLHWAADRGNLTAVGRLIEKGAFIDIQDDEGQTPLHYAFICENMDIVDFLIKSGANPLILDKNGYRYDQILS